MLFAAIVSAILLSVYSQLFLKQALNTSKAQPKVPSEPSTSVQLPQESLPMLQDEATATLTSPEVVLEIGTRTGQIRKAILREFRQSGSREPLVIGGRNPLVSLATVDGELRLQLIKQTDQSLTLGAADHNVNDYNITYTINSGNYLLNIKLQKISEISNKSLMLLLTNAWFRSDTSAGRSNILQVNALHTKSGGTAYSSYTGPVQSVKIVPRGTKLLTLSERYFCQVIKPDDAEFETSILRSPDHGTVVTRSAISIDRGVSLELFFGPRDFFHLKRAGLEAAFPIGTIGQIGLILLTILSGIASVTRNYGVAIIVFSAFITCITAPFTIMSFKSMRKMQELKPKIDKIMAQHKNDTAAANREVFQLYREHRVNPLSGCLPMLLQMPILIALFQAISHFIELRGKSFLWIKDLSLPDQLARLPFSIPILGSDINLLPLIMAGVMFIQTRMSQGMYPKDASNPTATMMSGPMMPVLFGFMFYHFPSSLVLYWLTNSSISLLWYRLAK